MVYCILGHFPIGLVQWCIWSTVHMIDCSHDPLFTFSVAPMVYCSHGPLSKWSSVHMVSFLLVYCKWSKCSHDLLFTVHMVYRSHGLFFIVYCSNGLFFSWSSVHMVYFSSSTVRMVYFSHGLMFKRLFVQERRRVY